MKVMKIGVGLSATISVAAFENTKPSFYMEVEPDNGESAEIAIENCRDLLRDMMEQESNRSRAEYLKKIYDFIRTYPRNGKQYPSVTSILSWDKDFHMPPGELDQYACRGVVVEAICNHWLKTGEWKEPAELGLTDNEAKSLAKLQSGNLKLTWENCSHKQFFEKYGDRIEVTSYQGTVYNDDLEYAGTYDYVGTYDGVPTLFDLKCGGHDFAQLAAYSMCVPDIKQLCVLKVGPCDNKSGYYQPKVETDIPKYFAEFKIKRAEFKKEFKI